MSLAELEHAIAMKFHPWMSKVDAEMRSLKETNGGLLEEVNILKARCKSLELSIKSLELSIKSLELSLNSPKFDAKSRQVETPIYTAVDHTQVCQRYAYQCSCGDGDYHDQDHELECRSDHSVRCICPWRYYIHSEHDQNCQLRVQKCICNVFSSTYGPSYSLESNHNEFNHNEYNHNETNHNETNQTNHNETNQTNHNETNRNETSYVYKVGVCQEDETTDSELDVSSGNEDECEDTHSRSWWSWFV